MLLAIIASLATLLHFWTHVFRGTSHELLWFCNVGSALVCVGMWLRRRELAAIGVAWIAFGTPMWLLDITTGGELLPTSFGTHFVVPFCGIAWLRRVGWPRGAWRWAAIATIVLLVVVRFVTPRAANVDLAFAVATGWERWFPSHALYLALLWSLAAATFWLVEQTLAPAKAPDRERPETDGPGA